MTHRQLKIVLAIGVLLAGGLVGLFFLLFEQVEEMKDVGFRGPARLNRFLAAERLFNRVGVPATSSFEDWELPADPQATLLLLNPHRVMTEDQGSELLDWVAAGGNLVAILPDAPSLDPLMLHFGVGAAEPEFAEEEEEIEVEEEKDGKDSKDAKDEKGAEGPVDPFADVVGEAVEVPLQDSPAGKPFKIYAQGFRRLLPPEDGPDEDDGLEVEAGSENGTFLLRYAYESGQVTFVSDAGFLTNDFIGKLDHGPFAWALVQGQGGPPAEILLVVRDEVPSLFTLLARHAWMVLVSGAFLMLAWLRLAGSRVGPVLPDPPRDRRSLLEHVEAAGAFLWQSGHAGELLQSTRQALLRRVEVRQPTWAKLPPRELADRLANALNAGNTAGSTGIAPMAVARALYGPLETEAADFVSTIQTLETLRRSL